MKPDLSANATKLACAGAARVVFLWNPGVAATEKMGEAGLSVDADGLSPIQMLELSTSLAAFSRAIAHATATRCGIDPDNAWKLALSQMDGPDRECSTRTMSVPVPAVGGGS